MRRTALEERKVIMAFTRKMLKALGIEDEKIEQIMEAHIEVVSALKEQIDENGTKAEELQKVQKELDSLRGGENWQEKYENERKSFEDYKTSVENEKSKEAKIKAYKTILEEAGVDSKRYDAIIRLVDLDSISLSKDGEINGREKLVESVKDEWSDYVVTTQQKGSNPPSPPANTSGSKMSKDEILNIKDSVERQNAIAENIELFK